MRQEDALPAASVSHTARCPTDHHTAYAMKKSVVGNTAGAALIIMNGQIRIFYHIKSPFLITAYDII